MILEIDGGHSGLRFSACHFIPRHEKCSRLHGHSYILRLRVEGDIGEDGMVMDFVLLKRELKRFIEEFDHRTLLPARSADVELSREGGSVVAAVSGGKRYVFPEEDTAVLDVVNTTAEEMARLMAERLASTLEFPPNVRSVSVGLDEERGQTAWFTAEVGGCRRPWCSCPGGWTPPRCWRRPSRTAARRPRSASGTARGTAGS